jgi:CYTH domain-containing protein
MGIEIERKFLVTSQEWRELADGIDYRQGYLSTVKERTVRVRTVGELGYITVKGITVGAKRSEFEYEIPRGDADSMLDFLCERPIIFKTRYTVPHRGHIWEIDDFHLENAGLIVAEVELADPDEWFAKPSWIGEEVTGDARYFNANLIAHPFCDWDTE